MTVFDAEIAETPAQGLVFEGAMQVWGAVDASRKKHLHAAMHVMSARALKNQQGEDGRTELKVVNLQACTKNPKHQT